MIVTTVALLLPPISHSPVIFLWNVHSQSFLCPFRGAQLVWLRPTGQGDAYYLVGLKLHHPRVLPNLPKFCMKDPAGTQTLVIVTLSKLIYHHTNHINSMFCLLWMSRNFGFNSTNRIPKWWWVVGMLLQALIDIDVGRGIKKIRMNKKS